MFETCLKNTKLNCDNVSRRLISSAFDMNLDEHDHMSKEKHLADMTDITCRHMDG